MLFTSRRKTNPTMGKSNGNPSAAVTAMLSKEERPITYWRPHCLEGECIAFPLAEKNKEEDTASSSDVSSVSSLSAPEDQGTTSSVLVEDSIGAPQERKEQCHVRFAETVYVCSKPAANSICQETEEQDHSSSFWYSPSELANFRKAVSSRSQQFASIDTEAERAYRSLLSTVYQACCDEEDQMDDSEQEGHQNDSLPEVLTFQQQTDLKRCAIKCPNRVGLECRLATAVNSDRNERRRVLLDTLSTLQRMNFESKEELEIRLSQASQRLSRHSRLFAREMGRAYTTFEV